MFLFIATYNSEITFMDTYISILGAKQRVDVSGEVMDFLYFTDESCLEKLHKHLLSRHPLELQIKFKVHFYLFFFICLY